MGVPAIFTIPAAVCIFVASNISHQHLVAYGALILGEIFFFTNNVPITTVVISVIPCHLRARSSGIQIFMMHILGDVISPPIIGGIATKLAPSPDALKIAIQCCWMAILLSGAFWFCGGMCLPRLPVARSMCHVSTMMGDGVDSGDSDEDEDSSGSATE